MLPQVSCSAGFTPRRDSCRESRKCKDCELDAALASFKDKTEARHDCGRCCENCKDNFRTAVDALVSTGFFVKTSDIRLEKCSKLGHCLKRWRFSWLEQFWVFHSDYLAARSRRAGGKALSWMDFAIGGRFLTGLLGEGTARFEILPRALQVIVGSTVEDGVFSAGAGEV
jgi:hypothetical protein